MDLTVRFAQRVQRTRSRRLEALLRPLACATLDTLDQTGERVHSVNPALTKHRLVLLFVLLVPPGSLLL